MSYEDLKNRLLEANDCDNIECVKEFNALRAVVKLHFFDNGGCWICPDFNYPCETIKAIEKELLS